LISNDTKAYCNRYTGVYLGLPGLLIGPIGLCIIGLLVPKNWAFRLALFHLIVCLAALIFDIVFADLKVRSCLNAQSESLKRYHEQENRRKDDYIAWKDWEHTKARHQFPYEQLPYATFPIIAAHVLMLVVAVVQIVTYALSAIILISGLGYAKYSQRPRESANLPHEIEALEPHDRHKPKEGGIKL